MPDFDAWNRRQVEILATGAMGRVVSVPWFSDNEIRLAIRVGNHVCNCDRCSFGGLLEHVTVTDGAEPVVRVIDSA